MNEQQQIKDETHGHRVSSRARLSERLTQRGAMPSPIPEPVLMSLALMQGAFQEFEEHLHRLEQSPILWSGIAQLKAAGQLGTSGIYVGHWQIEYKCVSVINLSQTTTITVAPDGEGDPDRPPLTGAGVHRVPPLTQGRFGITGHALTVYGTKGEFVDVQVASRWVDGL